MDIIFNMFKVKFVKMDELFMKHCKEINQDSKVNLFINLEPIIRKLSSTSVEDYLQVKNQEKIYEFISCMVNLAAHYRLFFTKNKLYSRIYLYMGNAKNEFKNRQFYADFRKAYTHKYTKDTSNIILSQTLNTIVPFTQTILECVEGVYLIDSGTAEPSLVPHIISTNLNDGFVNIILTTDRYDYQYVNKGYYILRPKKDESYMVSRENIFSILKQEDKLSSDVGEVQTTALPFILSLLGDKYRDLEKIKRVGLAAILKMLNKAIKDKILTKDVTSIAILSNILKKEFVPTVMQNFACTDIDSQYAALNIRDIHHIKNQLVDKFDNVSLKELNNRHFTSYPMMLIELMSANKLVEEKKPKKNIFLD